jgi:putative peptidoglycan lipid II flippase
LIGGFFQNLVVIGSLRHELKLIFATGLAQLSTETRSLIVRDVKIFFQRILVAVAGLGAGQGIALLNVHFASGLNAGALSYIYLGDRLLELPLSLVAVSLSSALLPTLSQKWGAGDHRHFVRTLAGQFEVLMFLLLPSALGLWFLAEPIVRVLFHHGVFQNDEVMMTSLVLRVDALVLLLLGVARLILAGLHAARSFWAGAVFSMMGLLVHFWLAKTLLAQEASLQSLMLATLGTTLFVTVALLFWFIYLVSQAGPMGWVELGSSGLRWILGRPGRATLVLVILLSSAQRFVFSDPTLSGIALATALAGTILFAGGIYIYLGRGPVWSQRSNP